MNRNWILDFYLKSGYFLSTRRASSHIPKNYMIEKVFNCCTSINLLHYYCCIEIFTKGKNSHKLFLLIIFLWKKNLKSKTMNSRFQCYYRNKFLLGVLSSRYYLEKNIFWSYSSKSNRIPSFWNYKRVKELHEKDKIMDRRLNLLLFNHHHLQSLILPCS